MTSPAESVHPSPRFRFEAGSYCVPPRVFLPSISCLEQWRPDEWRYHFVLIKPEADYIDEDDAATEARNDLEYAFAEPVGPVEMQLVKHLRAAGYVRVDSFQIAQ